ncbi:MAG TPA: response regulator [Bdellovibrionota bacterium]|nr:response regulator [Bdellovibrionota bacterium]
MGIHGKTALIVDDAADSRLIARRIVQNAGMAAVEASSVAEALTSVAGRTPHVVLLDLGLPGASGFSFLEERMRRPELAAVPVIVVSASSDRESVHRAVALGANDYAVKPITASILVRKIAKVLKDASFLTFRLPEGSRECVTVNFEAEISRPEETCLFLASPVRIGLRASVAIRSKVLLEDYGLQDCLFVSDLSPGMRSTDGQYYTRIEVQGLKKTITRSVKKAKAG